MKKLSKMVIVMIIFSCIVTNYPMYAKSTNENVKQKVINRKVENRRKTLDELPKKQEKEIIRIKKLLKTDANMAAEEINKITNDEEFLTGVDELLNDIYSNDDTVKNKLCEFEEVIDERAENLLDDYNEAYEERLKSENLNYQTDKILVSFDKNTSTEDINSVINDMGCECTILDEEIKVPDDLPKDKKEKLKLLENHFVSRVAIVDVSKRQTVDKAIEECSRYSSVTYAEKSKKLHTSAASGYVNDTNVKKQYYLDKINISKAWNLLENNGYVEQWVAVIDTGLDVAHSDIKSNYIKNYSVDITQPSMPRLCDISSSYSNRHGTFIAGLIAAQSNNSQGITGVATGGSNDVCKIMALKISTKKNNSLVMTDADLLKAYYYAMTHGADVINMSLGYDNEYDNYIESLQEYINMAYYLNIPTVVAVGNKGIHYAS